MVFVLVKKISLDFQLVYLSWFYLLNYSNLFIVSLLQNLRDFFFHSHFEILKYILINYSYLSPYF